MSNFIQRALEASRSKLPINAVIGLSFLSFGALCGYIKAKMISDMNNENYSEEYLKEYISEDQVNFNIDKTGKPAVIYYYQPGGIRHYLIRHGFIRGSTLCNKNADFYMVNLVKKLQKTIPQLQHNFPIDDYLMEIRFPKQNCQIQYTDGDHEEKVAYRREFFNNNYQKAGGVEDFLQENGLIPAKDPFQDFATLTKDCLFQPIQQTRQNSSKST